MSGCGPSAAGVAVSESERELQLIVFTESEGLDALAPQVAGEFRCEPMQGEDPFRSDGLDESEKIRKVGVVAEGEAVLASVRGIAASIQGPPA